MGSKERKDNKKAKNKNEKQKRRKRREESKKRLIKLYDLNFNKQKNKTYCTTLEETCEDCRQTKLEEIYTSHFTECGKPEYCAHLPHDTLCGKLMHEWHKVRFSLEMEWIDRYSTPDFSYIPDLKGSATPPDFATKTMGHCDGERGRGVAGYQKNEVGLNRQISARALRIRGV